MSEEIDWKAESEKEVAKLQEFKEYVRNFMVREEVKLELQAFETIDPELVAKLADTSGCSFDEESNVVTGASEAVQRLVAEKPYLFAPKIKSPPPPRMKNELLDAVQKELGIRKF
jgi:hypothetical protein